MLFASLMRARGPSPSSDSTLSKPGTPAPRVRSHDITWEPRLLERIVKIPTRITSIPRLRRRLQGAAGALLLLIAGYAGWLHTRDQFKDGLFSWISKWYQTEGEREIASNSLESEHNSDPSAQHSNNLSTEGENPKKKSIVILAGGGCESPNVNDFAQEFKRSIEAYERTGVELHVLFGSPHTGNAIRKPLGRLKPFHATAFDGELQALAERTDLNPGDSILIQLNTHGSNAAAQGVHEFCYDVPEDAALETEGHFSTIDLQLTLSQIRYRHPGIQIAVLDESCYGGATIEALSQIKDVCTLSSVSATLPAEYNEYFNHQFERALSHGWSMTRSFESALKDRFLRVRRNMDTPRMSGIPSADLDTYINLIEWGGEAAIQWEESLERENQGEQVIAIQAIAGETPEKLIQAAAALTGITGGDNAQARIEFAQAWSEASRLHERLEELATRGAGGATSAKRTRNLRKIAARVRTRLNALKSTTEHFTQTWNSEEGRAQIQQSVTPLPQEERNWDTYRRVRADLAPVFLELGRLRLRLGDIHRLLRELDPDSLIRDATGARRMDDWRACADFKLHVSLRN